MPVDEHLPDERLSIEEGSLVARARSLLAGIQARAEQTEQERRLPADTMEEFKRAGFTRAFQAKRYGGLEAPPEEFYRAVIEIGKVCTSSAWVMAVLAVHPFQFAQLPVEAQDEIFGNDINAIISSSYNPTGKVAPAPGGYRLSGRWSFSSGCDHASWVVLGGMTPNAGGELRQRIFLLPASDWRIDDDWHVLGLAGSGSKSIIVDDAYVPEHRTLDWIECCLGQGPGLAVNPGAIFRLPFLSVFGACLAVPAIGAAKGAYAEFCRQARERVMRGPDRKPMTEDPFLQLRLADAEAEINAAELLVMQDFREAMRLVEAGEKIPLVERARYRWHQVRAIDTCSKAVKSLLEVSGGSVIYHRNPIQRFYRDIVAAHQHSGNNREASAALMARTELGLAAPEFFA